jgi:glutaminyl-peptide cyclotransferase
MRRSALLLVLPACLAGCGPGGSTRATALPDGQVEKPTFDGAAAHDLIRDQVAFGPRVPGTEGHATQLAWMEGLLDLWADEVERQSFSFTTSRGETLHLTNLLARYRPGDEERILLLTHWDTRPLSDQAPDPADRDKPVPGANDGGSGTAVLLHLAELMSSAPPPHGVDLLFVDGEDYGPGTQDMFMGSTYFAALMPRPLPWRYGLLLDMVGDLDPRFPIEGYSADYAPLLAQEIWQVAHDLGFALFFPASVGSRVLDDHVPLNKAGLPTVDLIDFEYGPDNSLWHTPQDIPGNTSPETLQKVGEVVTELVYRGG